VDPNKATAEDIERAAWSTVPNVPVLFWSFRLMVGLGMFFIGLFAMAFIVTARRHIENHRGMLRIALYCLPLPWIAAELGWIVAEYGRQPWVIEGMLPTFLGASSLRSGHVIFSLIGFVLFYSTLAVVDVFLMLRVVRQGPEQWSGHEGAG
jgi:cytochrome d ubiquinol oxidase subunit I